jgi:hypothetical protein
MTKDEEYFKWAKDGIDGAYWASFEILFDSYVRQLEDEGGGATEHFLRGIALRNQARIAALEAYSVKS